MISMSIGAHAEYSHKPENGNELSGDIKPTGVAVAMALPCAAEDAQEAISDELEAAKEAELAAEKAAEEERIAEEAKAAEEAEETTEIPGVEDFEIENPNWDGRVLNARNGTVQGPSGKETYYNLDMTGVIRIMENLGYDYEYHVREDGVKMYGPYIMCAANLNIRPRGSLVLTSLGVAMVCDTGGYAKIDPTWIDIAVTW